MGWGLNVESSLVPAIACHWSPCDVASCICSGVLPWMVVRIGPGILTQPKSGPLPILTFASGTATVTYSVQVCSPSVLVVQLACHIPCVHFWKGEVRLLLKIRTL